MEQPAIGYANFLFGYAKGECFMVSNTVEQICAFIMKYSLDNVKIVDFLDQLEIETSMGFIMYAQRQDFLRDSLLPALVPMQRHEVKPPEFIPYVDEMIEN